MRAPISILFLILLVLSSCVQHGRAQQTTPPMPDSSDANAALVRSVFDALQSGDVQMLNRAFDPQGVSMVGIESQPRGGPFASFAEAASFPAALEPRTVTVESLIAVGDEVAVRSIICGKHHRRMLDFEPTGLEICARYHNLYRIRDGRIVENAVGIDRSQIRAQLEKNAQALTQGDAAPKVEAMFAALGGRTGWAQLHGYRIVAQHHLVAEPQPVANDILMDFASPRFRILSGFASGQREIRIDARDASNPQAWRSRDGVVSALSATEAKEQLRFWEQNVYRTLSRMARRDSALEVRLLGDGRLQVLERGQPLVWLRLNARHEPIGLGNGQTKEEEGTVFGPLRPFGGLNIPSFSIRNRGEWRAIIERFEVNPELTALEVARPPG